jgi:hypothetical protein
MWNIATISFQRNHNAAHKATSDHFLNLSYSYSICMVEYQLVDYVIYALCQNELDGLARFIRKDKKCEIQ